MTRWLSLGWVLIALGLIAWPAAGAESFKLADGQVIEGEPIGPTAQSVVIRKPDGSFSDRIPWDKFSQEALKKFEKIPATRKFVADLIEPEEEKEPQRKVAREIPFNTPPRLERPDPKAGFFSFLGSSIGLTLFFLLYAANVYAAYEIALFRNYPWMLVCGLSLVMPVITQAVFLCVPTRIKPVEEAVVPATEETAPQTYQVPGMAPPPEEEGAGVTPAPGAPTHPPTQVYQRGQFTFNRRFFETKLAGFLKVVPGEAEKDMVLEVTSLRGHHVAQRIVRIMPNDLVLLVAKGGATEEVIVPFTEVREIKVRHKDA